MKIEAASFGKHGDREVIAYTLTNEKGMSVECLNYGCIISKIIAPDRQSNFENVVLGFDTLEDYMRWSPYFGAVIGRVAGRIKGASIELDGVEYKLAENENGNHIHGGVQGLSNVIWEAVDFQDENGVGILFTYTSLDGEEGYPGQLNLKVMYKLTNDNILNISYEAKTDKKTIINLTNHSYFNLSGNVKNDILDHCLTMNSNVFLELDKELLPTGELLNGTNTAFDFRMGRVLREGTVSQHPQNLLVGKGYDHPFIFNEAKENTILLYDQESGRRLRVKTDQPCVVLYTSNQLEGDYQLSGVQVRRYLGVCLETQGYPDAVHHSQFPSIILDKNEVYQSTTTYQFSVY
ncbi:aldose epimerase family protein [Bacillus sp. FJAT-49736]|uniref:aldose epimerase family protein n=1 Tax=Bacillus sp. FJAT-49736 TaxID=2833582 RepID=UPI001BCA3477|nr:aldose epimerase family protein [Bacillus sp. FJAT-49736]MBS4174575.1 galactose mutarotase [Bacillus sp. FJAT-49736]